VPVRRPAVLAGFALLVGFLAIRTYHLTSLPIFIDESLHLFWAQRVREDLALDRPLRDGKPLQALVMAVTVPGADDPLWAGRFTSVLVGAAGMWAAWRIGRRLFDEPTGRAAAVLYLACPFTLFYDRMALSDVYLSTSAALALLASIAVVRDPRPRNGVALGLALAACVLSKVPGLMLAPLPLAAAFLLPPRRPGLWRALAIAYAVAALLAAYPAWFFLTRSGQLQKVAGVEEEIEVAQLLAGNLEDAARWLPTYWTWPVMLAGLAGVALGVVKRRGPELLLALASLAPVAVFVSLSFYWYPRYILFATVPFLVLAARVLTVLSRWATTRFVPGRVEPEALDRTCSGTSSGPRKREEVWIAGLLAVALVPALRFDLALLTDPARAPLPRLERFQYVDGFSSGYGCPEAVAWLRGELAADPGRVTVAAETPGRRTLFLCLRTYFMDEPRAELRWLDPNEPVGRRMLLERAAVHPTFVITGSKEAAGNRFASLGAVLLAQWRKPNGMLAGELYRVDGRPEAGEGPQGSR
jgi:dolichyl-phosphate-mannose-protein mannosyltransferase